MFSRTTEKQILLVTLVLATVFGILLARRESLVHVTSATCQKSDGQYRVELEIVNPKSYPVDAEVEILIGDHEGQQIYPEHHVWMTLAAGETQHELFALAANPLEKYGHSYRVSATVLSVRPQIQSHSRQH